MELLVKTFRKYLQRNIKKEYLVLIIFSCITFFGIRYLLEHGFQYTIGNLVLLISLLFLIFVCYTSDIDNIKIVNEYHMNAVETYSNMMREKYLQLTKTTEEHTYNPGVETIKKTVKRVKKWFASSIKKRIDFEDDDKNRINKIECKETEEIQYTSEVDNNNKNCGKNKRKNSTLSK